MFNILRTCHTVFQSSCTGLRSHQRWVRVPLSPFLCWHLLLFVFFVTASVDMKWCLIVVLLCLSLRTSDVEHCFLCFLAMSMSSVGKRLLKSFARLKDGAVIWLLNCKSSVCVLDTSCWSDLVCKCFLPFCGLSFHFPEGIICNTKILILRWFGDTLSGTPCCVSTLLLGACGQSTQDNGAGVGGLQCWVSRGMWEWHVLPWLIMGPWVHGCGSFSFFSAERDNDAVWPAAPTSASFPSHRPPQRGKFC